jgi:sn-glycerol 3-phosphate transport system substrate-binding protein
MKNYLNYKVMGAGMLVLFTLSNAEAAEKVNVKFWHAQRGAREKVLKELIDKFNEKNENIHVEMMFQGAYEETLNKYRSTLDTPESPNLIMVYDIGTRAMIDSGTIIPAQEFMDKDATFNKENFPAQIRDYYSLDNKMYAVPLGSSAPVMYYNKDLFKAAGLDPEKAPTSYAEIVEYSKKIAKVEGDKVSIAGMIYSSDPWPVEQYLANNNLFYVNENNGRTGVATEVAYVNDGGKAIFSWMKGMLKDKLANYFTLSKDGDAAFISGKAGMYFQSSAILTEVKENADFDLGVTFIPNISGEFNGAMVGGNALWMTKYGTEAEQAATWEFMKYVSSPEFQARWSVGTGYVPTNKLAYEVPEFKEYVEKFPQAMVAINELNESKATYATSGASFGSFPEARANMRVGLEKMFSTDTTIDQILKDIATETNKDIKRYNRTQKSK